MTTLTIVSQLRPVLCSRLIRITKVKRKVIKLRLHDNSRHQDTVRFERSKAV